MVPSGASISYSLATTFTIHEWTEGFSASGPAGSMAETGSLIMSIYGTGSLTYILRFWLGSAAFTEFGLFLLAVFLSFFISPG